MNSEMFTGSQVEMERELAKFIQANLFKISGNVKGLLELFNECGKKYNNEAMQVAFLSAVFLLLCRGSTVQKTQLEQALLNVRGKLK